MLNSAPTAPTRLNNFYMSANPATVGQCRFRDRRPNMDKLSVMNAFRRIVERGSFVSAANDLGVSPGLLSKEIKLLEKSLGCTLFKRNTLSMSLTEAGQESD